MNSCLFEWVKGSNVLPHFSILYTFNSRKYLQELLQAVVFSNPEEELIVAESELCIDYDVSGETENEVSVDFDGVEMTPWRRIVVFTADKLDDIIRNVRQNFPAGSQA